MTTTPVVDSITASGGITNGSASSSSSADGSSGSIDTNPEDNSSIMAGITEMEQAFELATNTNFLITATKTVLQAGETASEQRPQ